MYYLLIILFILIIIHLYSQNKVSEHFDDQCSVYKNTSLDWENKIQKCYLDLNDTKYKLYQATNQCKTNCDIEKDDIKLEYSKNINKLLKTIDNSYQKLMDDKNTMDTNYKKQIQLITNNYNTLIEKTNAIVENSNKGQEQATSTTNNINLLNGQLKNT